MNQLSPIRNEFAPPPLRLLARESMSFAYMRMTGMFGAAAPLKRAANCQSIMVIPGFMASDQSTERLRLSLNSAGYDAHGWGLGRNRQITTDLFERMETRLNALDLDAPITLIGWSLGGLIAREFAKHAPHLVAKVITLGSPFSGGPRANNAWRLYEVVAGHKVDNPPISAILHEKPPVPTVAFWSANDGIVAPRSACGLPDESDEQIELDCTHMAYIVRPEAIAAIAEVLG